MGHGEGRDGEAVTEAFTRLRDRLVGTAGGILGNAEDAREAVQDAFLKCWRRRDGYGSPGTLDALVFTVVLNAARDLRRRRAVRRAGALPPEETMPPDAREEAPAAAAERRDLVRRVRAAIPRLPGGERDVFLLRVNGEMTYEAIAAALRVPVGTAKTRMRAALKRLREARA